MKSIVTIPAALSQYTKGISQIEVDAATVDEALVKVDQLFPGLWAFLINESHELRRYVNLFVNNDNIRSGEGLKTRLKEGDRVQIIPAIAGG